jgi:hypothetical protein
MLNTRGKPFRIFVQRVHFNGGHAEGINIEGPSSTEVVNAFTTMLDALGANAIEEVDSERG